MGVLGLPSGLAMVLSEDTQLPGTATDRYHPCQIRQFDFLNRETAARLPCDRPERPITDNPARRQSVSAAANLVGALGKKRTTGRQGDRRPPRVE